MRRLSLGRLRHPAAAVLAASGIVLGSVAAVGNPATAAAGDLTATTTYDCKVGAFPNYAWDGTVTLNAKRPAGSDQVTVTATLSKMAGTAPVTLSGVQFESHLALDLGGTAVTLEGQGTVDLKGKGKDFDMPALQGTFTSTAADVAATVTSYTFDMPTFDMHGTCTPTAGAALGTLTIVEGTATPLPSASPSTTAKPSASPSATAGGGGGTKKGKAAKGKAAFDCTMNIGSTFDYDATIQVSGSRPKASDPITLVAKLSDLPGISPVAIQGSMDYTLDVEAGGEKVTLKSTDTVDAPAKQKVPVKDLTGTLDADGDEMEVAVTAFSFDFPSAAIGAKCTAKRTVLGTMRVGSEAVDSGDGDGGSGGAASAGGASLPKTGGADSLPVVALWALALTLLGAAGLLCVPQMGRRRS